MKSVSPKIASPRVRPKLLAGYFGDLAATGRIRLTAVTQVAFRYILECSVGMS